MSFVCQLSGGWELTVHQLLLLLPMAYLFGKSQKMQGDDDLVTRRYPILDLLYCLPLLENAEEGGETLLALNADAIKGIYSILLRDTNK
jgi:hypothetical protein